MEWAKNLQHNNLAQRPPGIKLDFFRANWYYFVQHNAYVAAYEDMSNESGINDLKAILSHFFQPAYNKQQITQMYKTRLNTFGIIQLVINYIASILLFLLIVIIPKLG